jgi:hypothetical protein
MCVNNFNQLHLRDAGPIEAAVGLSGGFFMIADQDEAIGVLSVHGDLLVPIGGELMDARLRDFGEFLEIRRVADVLQSPGDPVAVVGSIVPHELSFGVQHLRQLAVSERKFHSF